MLLEMTLCKDLEKQGGMWAAVLHVPIEIVESITPFFNLSGRGNLGRTQKNNLSFD